MEKCASITLMENGRSLLLGKVFLLLIPLPERLSTKFRVINFFMTEDVLYHLLSCSLDVYLFASEFLDEMVLRSENWQDFYV